MRRLLLDTHILLWWLGNDPILGSKTLQLISDPRNEVFISAVTNWEIAIKKQIGKLEAPDDIDTIVEDEGFSKLVITLYHGEIAGGLPMYHTDPFDRMLIAQAKTMALQLVTNDREIQQYDVHILNPLK
ncbi:MAG: type II toxin-antitoxin system VapC family toxin [Thermodesulfobacteriota bacterium]|nr:type II toxin-antitoxin system VapC family toxin [Thermodesulfobacteriota bacterium]